MPFLAGGSLRNFVDAIRMLLETQSFPAECGDDALINESKIVV